MVFFLYFLFSFYVARVELSILRFTVAVYFAGLNVYYLYVGVALIDK